MPAPSKESLTPFGFALAGAVGGVFSNAVVYPLDTVKTRIQAAHHSPSSADDKSTDQNASKKHRSSVLSDLLKILKKEGIRGFYGGFGASMLNTFSMQFAYFYWYTVVRQFYISRRSTLLRSKPGSASNPAISTAMELILGAAAGALAQIFTIPVSVIATRQQLGSVTSQERDAAEHHGHQPEGFWAVAADIIKEDGITGLWRGLKPSLVLTINPAITYGAFERVKGIVLAAASKAAEAGKGSWGVGQDGKMTPWLSFFVGALSKTLATIVTYPYIMAKVRLQAKYKPEEEDLPPPVQASTSKPQHSNGSAVETKANGSAKKKRERYSGAIDVLTKTYEVKGLPGWYQGMRAQITKAVLSQALLFMMKDMFEKYTLLALIIIRGATGVRFGI